MRTHPAAGSLLGIEALELKDIERILESAKRMQRNAVPLLRDRRGPT